MATRAVRLKYPLIAAAVIATTLLIAEARPQTPAMRFADQGPTWTADLRARYYRQPQGSQLMPLAWLKALRQADGHAFLDVSLTRYGYLAGADASELPIGFETTPSEKGTMVGMTCAACHVRDIVVDGRPLRIDGGPAFADFATLVADLDEAVHRLLADKAAFHDFAGVVLGSRATDADAAAILRVEVEIWWVRFDAWIGRSLPKKRRWGPGRLDAMGMIYNRLAGLDLGAPPTYLIPENIKTADAPTRYPFLWNSPRQDFAQWAGFDPNGNDFLALGRNLGQVYGVFADFHPHRSTEPAQSLNRNYLLENSADIAGLRQLEDYVKKIGPPVWPWPVDKDLGKQGEAVFNRSASAGGCADCHGARSGQPRQPVTETLRTVIANAGTDTRQWQILLRSVRTGGMEGASIPQSVPPLKPIEPALQLLRTAVLGAIVQTQAVAAKAQMTTGEQAHPYSPANAAITASMRQEQMNGMMVMPAPPNEAASNSPMTNVYEARVLEGIWAAAPYLHNGSVPTLADLLEPAAKRRKDFAVGPGYDRTQVGLAVTQNAAAFTFHATSCAEMASGDSNCGHEYGTHLRPDEKRALLEYLKIL